MPTLAEHSPDAILLIVSNGRTMWTSYHDLRRLEAVGFPVNCIIGYGTNLDSSKFLFLLHEHLDVNDQDVQVTVSHRQRPSSSKLAHSAVVSGLFARQQGGAACGGSAFPRSRRSTAVWDDVAAVLLLPSFLAPSSGPR